MSDKAIRQMTAKELLAHYQAKVDEEARQAKANGGLVCWSASVAPSELCVAMGIAMVYPETHAAGIGAKKGSLDLLDVADRKGYSVDCCSYGRVNIGYMELLKEEAMTGRTPKALAERGERWGPYRTYASLYLWRIADFSADPKPATNRSQD